MIKLQIIGQISLVSDFLPFYGLLPYNEYNIALKRLIHIVANVVDVLKKNQTVNLTVRFVDSQGLTDKTEQFGEQ